MTLNEPLKIQKKIDGYTCQICGIYHPSNTCYYFKGEKEKYCPNCFIQRIRKYFDVMVKQ